MLTLSEGTRVKVVDPFGKAPDRYGRVVVEIVEADFVNYLIRFDDDDSYGEVWEFYVSEASDE